MENKIGYIRGYKCVQNRIEFICQINENYIVMSTSEHVRLYPEQHKLRIFTDDNLHTNNYNVFYAKNTIMTIYKYQTKILKYLLQDLKEVEDVLIPFRK